MKIIRTILVLPIRAYQVAISPWLGPRCRFIPSCSGYAREAIETHGAFKGLYLAVRRLLRCHPWGGQGIDPVPPSQSSPCTADQLPIQKGRINKSD